MEANFSRLLGLHAKGTCLFFMPFTTSGGDYETKDNGGNLSSVEVNGNFATDFSGAIVPPSE